MISVAKAFTRSSTQRSPIVNQLGALASSLAIGAISITSTLLYAPSAMAQTFTCDGKFYLAQNNPSNYFIVNTATNALDPALNPGVYTNAIGYNRVDDFIYGIHANNGNIYRIKSDGTFDSLGTVTDGNGTVIRSFAGDVDPNGIFYILNTSQTTAEGPRRRVLYRIQVTGQGTAQLIGSTLLSEAVSVADLAFNPIDGRAYGVQGSRVVQVDPNTGNVVRFTTTATPSISSAGATYFDGFGNFYAYNNGSGNIIRYVLSGTTATGTLYATGPRVSLNDGAACPYRPQLQKTVSPTPIRAGQRITYTYQIANPNPNAAVNGVTFTDVMPATDGRTYVPGTLSVPGGIGGTPSFSNGNKTLTINGLNLPPNSVNTLSIEVDVPLNTPSGFVQNQANLTLTSGVVIESDFPPTGTPEDETPLEILPPFADLSLSKSVDNPLATNGDQVIYTISVTNTGPGDATGVTISEPLAAGLNFVSSTPSQGTYNSGTGQWAVGTIPNGTTATLQITVDVTTATPTTNTSQVTASDQPDPDSTPNNNDPNEDDQGSVTIPTAASDLNLTKTLQTATPINLGDNVTFQISVRNDGASNATGVTITDQLPPGLTFVSATPSDGTDTYDPVTGLWTLGNLANGTTNTIDIIATVDTVNAINNVALVSGLDQVDPDPTDNQDDATVPAQQADLSLTKSASNNTPNLGENVTFTLTVTNNGPNNASGVEVTDQLPAGLALVSATPTDPTDIYNSNTGVWTIGNIPNGGNATLTIVATANSTDTLTNTATITDTDQSDPNPNNNSDNDTVDGQQADLSLTKSANPTNATNGDTLTYTITVNNNGPDPATNVQVLEQIPAGLTVGSITPEPGSTFNVVSPNIWNIPTIPSGGTATLTIQGVVNTTAPIVNVARIEASDQPDPDSTAGNDDLSEDDQDSVVTPAQQADLELTKTVDNATPNVGDNATYTLTLFNNAAGVAPATPVAATNVQITDQLPAGMTFVAATPSQGTYNPTSGIWNVGTVPINGTVTLQIVAVAGTTNTLTNTATVTDSDQVDPDPNDNQDTADVTGQLADLEVNKTVDNPNAELGDTINYTVTINNNGPSTATNVQVLEQIPAGLINVSSSTTGSTSFDPNTNLWTIGTMANGATETLTITATIDTVQAITNVASVTNVDQPDPDSDPSDDDTGEDDTGVNTLGQRSDPNLRLVKRITQLVGINGTTNFTSFANTSNNANLLQQAGLTPIGASQVNTNPPAQSGDIVEYTIYFLSDGNVPATPAAVCDLIPPNTTFLPNGYGPNQGLQIQFAGATTPTAQTNAADGDAAAYYSPLAPLPAGNPCVNPANPNGAVLINFGAVASTPGANTGFIRFRVQLN
ncbi:DUF11 domain-containing protein [filamentous cyanobacterium LEGE 11480]|uniref:DUF11 domain-containing protein n=1 Tax=Romeriopsis navalis LEGE 11480 TaxID=2777977 RepID=A0A928VJQ1_9CYAN|nr:DUF11 domain-containing protein [Romeriopsis navalis]MBE9029841.1 DUF11 domain-containing protein [Romeriopsis navalis LEGE 11480]